MYYLIDKILNSPLARVRLLVGIIVLIIFGGFIYYFLYWRKMRQRYF